ncbi:PfkB family carbohydrate kinase [Pseudonocardia spinosispora]|uniref:PfkB family carbohydrate kinase n=1 Tax=Pseudonocardia spinosispora TaxID=103441 RepID=UPI00041AEABF|nr:PfkB family carbohydrate kinase [Pseudonocardia spinosispora]
MRPRVVVVGDCIVDEIHEPSGSSRWAGGAGLNLAVGLSVLGLPSALIGQVGADEDGDRLRGYLRGHGVVLREHRGAATGLAVSWRTGGEPRYRFNDALLSRRLTFGDADLRLVAGSAALVVNSISHDDAEQAAELRGLWSAAAGVRAIDPNPRPALLRDADLHRLNFEELAAEADLVKISDEDAALLYPGRDLDRVGRLLLDLGAPVVLLTRGAEGASVLTGTGRVDEPTARLGASVVDTMGAGDATLAVLLAHRVRHGAPADHSAWTPVLHEAMHVAAATCRHRGGLLRRPA